MKSIPLRKSGVAYAQIDIATTDGKDMVECHFIVDTGATRTTIPKDILVDKLGYSSDWIDKNKVIIPDDEKPTMANGKKADVYKIPITRINIGGHEIQPDDYVLTSDSIKLSFLLGLDILSYFKFTFDFDAVDEKAKYGRMFYEFRQSRKKEYSKLGEPFAYQLDDSQQN